MQRAVDQGLGDRTGQDGGGEFVAVAADGGQFHVDPGAQGEAGGVGAALGDLVQGLQEADGEVVGDDGALEAPGVAEQPGEQGGSAADGTPSISAYDCMTERAPPSMRAISKGGRMTSASSLAPARTGERLRAPADAAYPAKCLRVATMPADSRPFTYAVPMVATR